jgi:hypothetical protein
MKPITVSSSSAPLKVPVYDRLRDEFAMAALTGILAAGFADKLRSPGSPYAGAGCEGLASLAYTLADAMLKQREAS